MDDESSRAEQHAKESDDAKSDPKPQARGLSELIIPHLLNLYGSSATARDFEIYAPNATFEDPLMRARGYELICEVLLGRVKQIKSAFYSLPKVFSESRIVEYTVQENAIGPGKVEVLIDNKQHYKFCGKVVDLASLIKLEIEEGKVIRHEDWWDKKPLKNRDTVKLPLVGRLAEVTRRGSMLVTHALMGFGKDPAP
ncbi:hypothetical protein ACMD2_07174 [Ananas comosus]|uniref:Uncharacterized protein n=1 Tax=Ananas comosus TaxID=4615 RepID=A0A199W5V1_ANACO|nr:hypothetical protein ACMD2_07174 [Ananas comosus]